MMTIGVNSRMYQNSGTGIPYFIKHLYLTLLEIDKKNKYLFFQTNKKKTLGETRTIWSPGHTAGNALFDACLVDRLVKGEKTDVFHGPAHVLPVVKRKRTKYVVTVHDLSFLTFPEHYPAAFYYYYRKAVGWSLRNADVIVADSVSTKEDIVKFYPVDEARVNVIPLGVNAFFSQDSETPVERLVPETYIFSLTTHPRRKNIHSVLAVLSRSRAFRNMRYVIAGLMPEVYVNELKKEIAALGLNGRVILFGYATDAQLKNLYRHAEFFIYPSFYEGFGFPVLESMACRTPVIASGTSSLTELMPQSEWRINPHDVDDIQEKMEKVLALAGNERPDLIERNYEFAKKFTWGETALRYLKLYEGVCA